MIADVAPEAGEPHVLSGPDKFLHTDLEKIFKDKGIKTVIAVGTAANGAVLYTGVRRDLARHESDRAGRRHVVDRSLMPICSTVFTFTNGAGGCRRKSTLTRSEMIKF